MTHIVSSSFIHSLQPVCYSPHQLAQRTDHAWAAAQPHLFLRNTQRLSSVLLSLNLLKPSPKSYTEFSNVSNAIKTNPEIRTFANNPTLSLQERNKGLQGFGLFAGLSPGGRILFPMSQKNFSACYQRTDISEKLRVLLRTPVSSALWRNTRVSSPSCRQHR